MLFWWLQDLRDDADRQWIVWCTNLTELYEPGCEKEKLLSALPGLARRTSTSVTWQHLPFQLSSHERAIELHWLHDRHHMRYTQL